MATNEQFLNKKQVDDQTPSIPLPARKQFDLANHATIKIL
jgi:hypothetical protein